MSGAIKEDMTRDTIKPNQLQSDAIQAQSRSLGRHLMRGAIRRTQTHSDAIRDSQPLGYPNMGARQTVHVVRLRPHALPNLPFADEAVREARGDVTLLVSLQPRRGLHRPVVLWLDRARMHASVDLISGT